MIYKLERLGTVEDNNGSFLINEAVKVKYVVDTQIINGKEQEGLRADIDFNESDITEAEAQELAQELITKIIKEQI